jgi:hypothetical protein
VCALNHIVGILVGRISNAARDEGIIEVPDDVLSVWATEQARLISRENSEPEFKARCAEVVLRFNGSVVDLPLICWAGKWFNSADLRKRVAREDKICIHVGEVTHEDDYDFVSKLEFEQSFKMSDLIVVVPTLRPSLGTSQIRELILSELSEVWGSYVEEDEDLTVGHVGREAVNRYVTVFRRSE